MTDQVTMTPDDLLSPMRDRCESGNPNACFYVVAKRMDDDKPTFAIVPCMIEPDATLRAIRDLAEKQGMRIDGLYFTADTYRFLDEKPPPDDFDFEAAHEAGDPRITDAIIAAHVSRDGDSWFWLQPYINVDTDYVWDDPKEVGEELHADVETTRELAGHLAGDYVQRDLVLTDLREVFE